MPIFGSTCGVTNITKYLLVSGDITTRNKFIVTGTKTMKRQTMVVGATK